MPNFGLKNSNLVNIQREGTLPIRTDLIGLLICLDMMGEDLRALPSIIC